MKIPVFTKLTLDDVQPTPKPEESAIPESEALPTTLEQLDAELDILNEHIAYQSRRVAVIFGQQRQLEQEMEALHKELARLRNVRSKVYAERGKLKGKS